jgi:hypothetical protein
VVVFASNVWQLWHMHCYPCCAGERLCWVLNVTWGVLVLCPALLLAQPIGPLVVLGLRLIQQQSVLTFLACPLAPLPPLHLPALTSSPVVPSLLQRHRPAGAVPPQAAAAVQRRR